MRNEKFRSGRYSTKFIPEEYPEGFHGVTLTDVETNEMIAYAALLHQARIEHSKLNLSNIRTPTPNSADADQNNVDEFVVVVGGPKGKAYKAKLTLEEGQMEVLINDMESGKGGRVVLRGMEWRVGDPLAKLYRSPYDGEKPQLKYPMTTDDSYDDGLEEENLIDDYLQIESQSGEGYELRYKGHQQNVIVRSIRQHELSSHMLPPEKKDYSNVILCPMPGTLVALEVEVGQEVEEGQPVAVVEAMKMQNVIRSPRKGIIKGIKSKEGAHLKVDEVILDFETN